MMVIYPMRNGIVKIQVAENKETLRNKCADAALWLWKTGLMSASGLSVYAPIGIVNAKKVLGSRLSDALSARMQG